MSTRAWRTFLVSGLSAAIVLAGGWTAAPQTNGAIFSALDFYDRGDPDWAIRTLPIRDLTVGELTSQAERWIEAGRPGTIRRRTLVAAAFTLELVWNTTRNEWSARASYPIDQTGRFSFADRDVW